MYEPPNSIQGSIPSFGTVVGDKTGVREDCAEPLLCEFLFVEVLSSFLLLPLPISLDQQGLIECQHAYIYEHTNALHQTMVAVVLSTGGVDVSDNIGFFNSPACEKGHLCKIICIKSNSSWLSITRTLH